MCVVSTGVLRCSSSACLAHVSGLSELRRGMRQCLQTVPMMDVRVDDAELVVDTLASNALQHGCDPVHVQVQCTGEPNPLLVEAFDSSPVPAVVFAPGTPELMLLDALTVHWGVVPGAGGKTVWAELPSVA